VQHRSSSHRELADRERGYAVQDMDAEFGKGLSVSAPQALYRVGRTRRDGLSSDVCPALGVVLDDRACPDYLDWLRFGSGLPALRGCRRAGRWPTDTLICWLLPAVLPDSGQVFYRTRTPLTVWFAGLWFLTSRGDGASPRRQRVLVLRSDETAWRVLPRTAMVRPAREKLFFCRGRRDIHRGLQPRSTDVGQRKEVRGVP